MRLLGIDYGRRKVGLAISEGKLAEPLCVVRYSDTKILEQKIKKIIESEKIEKVVVGISEGQMGEETKKFINAIRYTLLPVPIETFDETLSTYEAKKLSISADMKRIKRKEMEDAFAAAIMLQSYLDQYV